MERVFKHNECLKCSRLEKNENVSPLCWKERHMLRKYSRLAYTTTADSEILKCIQDAHLT